METGSISRAALGSVAKLGDLYDARRDKFCGISILKDSAPDSAIQTRDNPFSDTKYFHSDKYSDKFDKLDVKAELKLSVLCGLFSLKGSGRYFRDEKSSKRAVRCTLMYNICTKIEELSIFNDALKECIELDALQQEATHVVVGISWGANLMVTAEYSNEENEDTKEISGALQAKLNVIAVQISGKGDVDYGKGGSSKVKEFSLNIYGDVLPEGDLPQTIEGAVELMKKLPVLVQKSNDGKGKPLHYVLLPVDVLKSHFKIHREADTIVKRLNEDAILRVVHLFDDINEAKQQLNDLYTDVTKHDFCVLDSTRKSVEDLKSKADISEANIRSQLSHLLVEIRSGRAAPMELEDLRQKYEEDPNSAPNILKVIHVQFKHASDKINLYKLLTTKHGVTYVSKMESSLDTALLQFYGKDIYILFSQTEAKTADKELWSKQLHLFLSLIEENKQKDQPSESTPQEPPAFLYVDLDVAPQLSPPGDQAIVVQHFKNGKCISRDLLEDYSEVASLCLVKSSSVVFCDGKPSKRTTLEIRCPASLHGECENDVRKWVCFKCKTDVEFGFDDYFYCNCGKGKADTYSYRCSSDLHGNVFQKFKSDEETLKQLLGLLKPLKELNILILGETGVGKSTWINGIVNYLSYSSLLEAENGKLLSVIPTSFSVTNDDYEEVIIRTGNDTNEDAQAGNSATQYPKSYTFSRGDTLVRLIDTPGIGDVRGITQDKENFKRILDHLSYVPEIHGICILLKPNNARLTIVFQFCIKELLTHLHRDASKNIVFCFTNARSTFYKPGDTLSALKRLLSENKDVEIPISKHTMYCMDNEAFRFLAAVKNGIEFSDNDRINFSASWDKSVEETDRLLGHIQSLKPHTTKDTLSLNDARKLITELTKPLADVSKNIQDNISLAKDKEDEITKIDEHCADLATRLQIPAVDLVAEPLGYPRTVCGASKCIEIIKGNNGVGVENYKQICHEHCGISGVSTGTKHQTELNYCAAMTGPPNQRYCNYCGCPWFEHMHQTYKTTKVQKLVEDAGVKEMLNNRKGNKATIATFIDTLQTKVKVLESEQAIITQVSAEFATFLQRNAITPYNDVMSDYLDHLIRVEQDKVTLGNNRKVLDSLNDMKSNYTHEVNILKESISSSSSSQEEITPQRVTELVDKLCQLKETGAQLKQTIDVVTSSNRKAAQYHEAPLVPQRYSYSHSKNDKKKNKKKSESSEDSSVTGWLKRKFF